MSHIPSSAMPHAGPTPQTEEETGESRFGQLAGMVREHPKTAAAVGAAAAGLVAAAAIPAIRSRSRSGTKSESGKGGRKRG